MCLFLFFLPAFFFPQSFLSLFYCSLHRKCLDCILSLFCVDFLRCFITFFVFLSGFLFWRFVQFFAPQNLWKKSSSEWRDFQFPVVFGVLLLTCSHFYISCRAWLQLFFFFSWFARVRVCCTSLLRRIQFEQVTHGDFCPHRKYKDFLKSAPDFFSFLNELLPSAFL